MVGIYKYSNGLQFTGIIANTKEEAEAYLANKYGYWDKRFTGKRDEKGCRIYEDALTPYYNKEVFEIRELTIV